jgi:putative hydrolase of the HAD superfamily
MCSLPADVLPVVAIGGRAVHIPYPIAWAHKEVRDVDPEQRAYVRLKHIGLLPPWLEEAK